MTKRQRKIIHVDMDAFFASVEQLDDPSLRGKPVVVGGGGKRGVVAAASYEARQFGVHSAMPGQRARSLCPDLIFVKHSFTRYKQVSAAIREIFHRYTALVEPLSLDEAFLDVSECTQCEGSATRIAAQIRREIFESQGLTASAGISFNKFLAKIASDLNKPNGQALILPRDAMAFVAALEVRKFFGIGKVTAGKMQKLGINTGADLRKFDESQLRQWFGKAGGHYYRICRAQDERPVCSESERKSISVETTYEDDLKTEDEMFGELERLGSEMLARCRRAGLFGSTVILKIRFADFKTITRSRSVPSPVMQDQEIELILRSLLGLARVNGRSVRLLGLGVSALSEAGADHQLSLGFGGSHVQ